MANITAAMVKDLRELTGAGMMDCKKALGETDGDMDAAVEYLRKNGQAKAEKKAGRIAAEGLCKVVLKDDRTAAVVEVNSETDFVAKNEVFQSFVAAVADQAVDSSAADMDAFMAEKWNQDNSITVKEALVAQIAKIGENLNIRRFEKVVADNGCVVSYTHGGGRIGVIVEAETDVVNDAIKEAMTNVAMQIAALNTPYLNESEVPAEIIEHEKEVMRQQVINEGKPEQIADKIVMGKIGKFYKENCLLDQEFVKDNKINIKQYTQNTAKELGGSIEIKKFVRFEKGEGIEKRQDDFAAEVASMVK